MTGSLKGEGPVARFLALSLFLTGDFLGEGKIVVAESGATDGTVVGEGSGLDTERKTDAREKRKQCLI